jgi:hypothetical protein
MDIPVTFSFEGKEIHGTISHVTGTGNNASYHLTVNNFYWGVLRYVTGGPGPNGMHPVKAEWRFTSNVHPGLETLGEYFGGVVAGTG